MNKFQLNFIDYMLSGHAMLSINTHEKNRATSQIVEAANSAGRQVFIWSIVTGWRDVEGNSKVDDSRPNPEIAVQDLAKLDEESVCIFKDFGCYLHHETYATYDIVVAWLDELTQFVIGNGQTIVFVGADFHVPNSLRHNVTEIDFDLPDKPQIEKNIRYICEDVQSESGNKFKPSMSAISEIIEACKGMTEQQIRDRVALALRRHKDFNEDAVKTILHEKSGIIRSSGLLTYIEPPCGGLDNVGGYDALKQHVMLDRPCFSEKARKFGIEFPKGILMVGVPGCGKTLLSLAIASEFGLPLISLDVGSIMNKFVGESEANMREAIKIIERVSPCVLQLDEIEKGFGGNGGETDGGSSKRVFGTFLKWLSERTSPVYIIATANEVASLPPEFSRKGRFDEIFGLDLPTIEEREQIFEIHLSKREKITSDFRLNELAKKADGFTGADIEQAVKLSMKMAFVNGDKLSCDIMLQAIKSIIPLSKTEPQRIDMIRKWCETRAKQANPQAKQIAPASRRVTIR